MEFQASYHQERLWFIDRFETGNVYPHPPIYHNIPLLMEIKGDIDNDLLQRSLQLLVNRHEALRTIVVTKEEEPVQMICSDIPVKFEITEIDGYDTHAVDTHWLELAQKKGGRYFVMGEDHLIKATLIRLEPQSHFLMVLIHHIVADRVSLEIIATELVQIYRALLEGKEPALNELPLQFADFAQWQRQLPATVIESTLLYWKRKLNGKLQALELPVDFPRAAIHVYDEALYSFRVPVDLLAKARNLWGGVSDFLILLGIFKLLLSRYSGNDEVVVGTSSRYRQQPGTEGVVGPMANLLVLRSHLDRGHSFKDVLGQLEKTVNDARKHQDLPFDKLVAEIKPDIDMSRTALFDVLFNVESPCPQLPEMDGVEFRMVETNSGFGKYDINLLFREEGDGFKGYLNYNALLFSKEFVRQLATHFTVLLERMLEWEDRPWATIPLVTEEEKRRMLQEWNDTASTYLEDMMLHEVFDDTAGRFGNRVALLFGDQILSYGELAKQTDQLACYLRERCGIGPGELVALSMEPSLDLMIGLLGILKSGAAYVPIEPSQPERRIHFVLRDSNCRIVVTNGFEGDFANGLTVREVTPADWRDWEPQNTVTPVLRQSSIEDPAYVIYTSGTTGRPKGCVVSHRNVVRLFKCRDFPFDIGPEDTWILAHAVNFDFSVWEIFGSLLFGGRLTVLSRADVRDVDLFLLHIARYRVSVLNQTPRAFYGLVEAASSNVYLQSLSHLRYVIFGGDRLEPPQLKDWVMMAPLDSVQLINMFGITETTVHVTYYSVTAEDVLDGNGASPIGVPLPETEVYLLDESLCLQPTSVCGEIYVGGSGVASGYLNRPNLSAERFVDNPFKPGELLYRSGDLGRWRRDGSIEYIGRADGQVKVRGYRIETGEIECQMRALKGITGAVVVARSDGGDSSLIGYFISEGIWDLGDLRSFLLKNLPEYMVPAHFIQLEEFPLTENGKLDMASLPEPDLSADILVVPANTETEAKLVEIWADVLKVDPGVIGIDTNFFNLGGHSLNATLLVSRMHREFNVKLPIADIFKTPFVREIGRSIDSAIFLASMDSRSVNDDSDDEREEILI